MSIKIRKSQISNFFVFLAILFSILLSRTVYWGIIKRETYQYVYFCVILLLLIFCAIERKKLESGIMITFPLMFLMIFNILINKSEMTSSNVNLSLGNCLYIIAATFTAISIEKKLFAKWYIRLMEIMCVISLPCWIIAVVNPTLALALCQQGYDWRTRYGYSPFYTWGWNGVIFGRNSGMFWEPGAFQGFILLAILMLLFNVDEGEEKGRKIKLILFAGTMLTTQSTTGYILLIVLILCCWSRIQNLIGAHSGRLKVLMAAFLGAGALLIIFSSGNISAKFSVNNISFENRLADIFGGLAMCLKGGLIGLGETTTRDAARIILGVNSDDSVGMLAMTYTYGLLFGAYYIGLMCCGVKKFFNNAKTKEYVILLMIFFVLHMTEGLWCLPIYLVIPLSGIISRGRTALKDNPRVE